MTRTHDRSPLATELPGLTALLLYLRPVSRHVLLRCSGELGVFVVEASDASLSRTLWPVVAGLDFIVVACANDPAHVTMVHRLVETTSLPVLVLTSSAAEFASFLDAGACACVADGSGRTSIWDAFTTVARRARTRRRHPERGRKHLVFGDVDFQTSPPELRRGPAVASLSPAEAIILETFVRRRGATVTFEEIQRQLTASDRTLSDGNLKYMIHRIRNKASRIGADRALLGSVRGEGYVLRE